MKKIYFFILLTVIMSACHQKEENQDLKQEKMINEECLICKEHLIYLEKEEMMECAVCHQQFSSKTRCVNGHFVCDDCHRSGIDSIFQFCLQETSKNPVEILEKMMKMSFCHMHGPEHHILVGSALLTAYKNAGGDIDLSEALLEMMKRGKQVPGGACGYWGACGAGISTGMFVSIISKATPMSEESWGLSNLMTSRALERLGSIGGPRCCKRDSYLSILAAIDFVKEHFNVEMEKPEIHCSRHQLNNQCIGSRCPFNPEYKGEK